MSEQSGLVKAAEENTTKASGSYCGRCGNPSCICGAKPSEATVAMPGNKNTLDAAFGAVADEHGSSMFKGLK